MPNEDIMRFWGLKKLKRWSAASVADVAIPESSKRFLTEVGLPDMEDWTMRFGPEDNMVPRVPANGSRRRIGFDDIVPICLDEKGEGCVVAVETVVGGSDRFMNSSVERLGLFLVLYQKYRKAARTVSEEKILEMIPRTEEAMRKADPKAFDDANNYWPVIIEQMNDGLL